MVTKTVVSVLDDIDGSEGAETVAFSLRDASYEIDLARENLAALTDALAPFIGAARETNGGAASRRKPARRRADAAEVRAWAAEQGMAVSARGRISRQVLERYSER
ncbi:MAG: Lsr2 family protein [Microbacteriaceae bacterium]